MYADHLAVLQSNRQRTQKHKAIHSQPSFSQGWCVARHPRPPFHCMHTDTPAHNAQPYETTEKELQREFGVYGPIERIRVVRDKEGKSRGYAFLVYEKERDMRSE